MISYPNNVIFMGGGPTAVINRTLHGVFNAWLRDEMGILYGSLFGVKGLIKNNLIDLTKIGSATMGLVGYSPGAALGTARYSLRRRDEKKSLKIGDLEKIFDTFNQYKIGYVLGIGGEDTRQVIRDILFYAQKIGRNLRGAHIPKTIDNDLTDLHHCPGYATAAKFVVWAVAGLDLENRSMPSYITINITMGRKTGWLAAASIMARRKKEDGPHLVYLPEVDFSPSSFLSDIDEVMQKYNRAHIVVSEGIAEQEAVSRYLINRGAGDFLLKFAEKRDSFGHPQLSGTGLFGVVLRDMVVTGLGIDRVRVNVFDYLQRSFPLSSGVDDSQAYAVGQHAFRAARKSEQGMMIALGKDILPYDSRINYVPLPLILKEGDEENWGRIKLFPSELVVNGNDISEKAFKDYVGPLIGDIPPLETLDWNSLKVKG